MPGLHANPRSAILWGQGARLAGLPRTKADLPTCAGVAERHGGHHRGEGLRMGVHATALKATWYPRPALLCRCDTKGSVPSPGETLVTGGPLRFQSVITRAQQLTCGGRSLGIGSHGTCTLSVPPLPGPPGMAQGALSDLWPGLARMPLEGVQSWHLAEGPATLSFKPRGRHGSSSLQTDPGRYITFPEPWADPLPRKAHGQDTPPRGELARTGWAAWRGVSGNLKETVRTQTRPHNCSWSCRRTAAPWVCCSTRGTKTPGPSAHPTRGPLHSSPSKFLLEPSVSTPHRTEVLELEKMGLPGRSDYSTLVQLVQPPDLWPRLRWRQRQPRSRAGPA